jgi:hypothetical protein
MTQSPENKVEKRSEPSKVGDKPLKDVAITTAEGNQRQSEIKRGDALRSFKLTAENAHTGERQQSFTIDMGDGREVKDQRQLRVDTNGYLRAKTSDEGMDRGGDKSVNTSATTDSIPKANIVNNPAIELSAGEAKKLVDTVSAKIAEQVHATQSTAFGEVLDFLKRLSTQKNTADALANLAFPIETPVTNLMRSSDAYIRNLDTTEPTHQSDSAQSKFSERSDSHRISDKSPDKPKESPAAAASHQKLDAWADKQMQYVEKRRHELEKDFAGNFKEIQKLKAEESQLRSFKREIAEFEKRCAKQPGMDPAEVEKTLHQLERITDAKGESPMPSVDRRHIAEQILHQAADPQSIDQGSHNTCNVTTIEARTYTRTPSEAAKLVADVALTGQYTSHSVTMPDGKVVPGVSVHLDPNPHDQSKDFPTNDGTRSYASELFQVTAVNLHYRIENAQGKSDIEYRQKDGKEELWDKKADKPVMKDGKPCSEPNLNDSAYSEISDAITGKKEGKDVAIVNDDYHSGKLENVLVIKKPQDLDDQLKRLKAEHKLPVIIRVNCECDPFYNDSGRAASGDSADAHVVTVTDYDDKNKLVTVDNQWGSQHDHQGTKSGRVPLNDLYTATQNTEDALKSVQSEIANSQPHPDRVKLMEEARLELVTGKWWAKEKANEIAHNIENEWSTLTAAEKNRDRIALIAMFGRMETTDRIDSLAEAHRKSKDVKDDKQKILDDQQLEDQLVVCGLLSEHKHNNNPIDFGRYADEQKHLEEALKELPEARRLAVRARIKHALEDEKKAGK